MAIDTLGANALASNSVTAAKIADDAVVAADIADGSITTAKLADNAVTSAKALNLGRRNIIINGAMQIAQRATSSTGLGAASGYFTLDRFNMSINSASAGRYTMSQSAVTDLEGFSNALKIQCTTADTSIASGEVLILQHRLEGQDLQRLKSTSTTTKAFTISFYAKSNASRAISLEARFSNGTNRQAATLHTIGTSWARYTMTVPASSSMQIDNDNSNEMQINLFLHAGSDFTSGTIQGSTLGAADNTKRASGIGSIFSSTSNTLEITGFQMEVGDTATDFEHRSVGEELAACQRYYKRYNVGSDTAYSRLVVSTYSDTTSRFYVTMQLPVELRTTPTMAQSSLTLNGTAVTSIANVGGTQAMSFVFNHGGSIATNNQYQVYGASGTGTLEFIAEL